MDLSKYILEQLRKDQDFTSYRGRHQHPDRSEGPTSLLMSPMPLHPAFFRLGQSGHENPLRSELGRTSDPHPNSTDRVAVSHLLASQTAISLDNAALYSDPQLQVSLLQNLPVSAWALKPDGTPDFVNQVWLEFAGQTLDFVRSHPEAWMTAVHPEDREMAARSFWEGVHSGQGFAMETRSLRAQDGLYRWHLNQAVVLRDSQGNVLKYVGTTTDIDDQKRAEELRASEEELRQILNSIPGQVCTLNPAGLIELANQPLTEYFGMTVEQLNMWEGDNGSVHPEDFP